MRALCFSVVLVVACTSCKPIARQEPVSSELSAAATFSRLLNKGRLNEARQLVRKLIGKGNELTVSTAVITQVEAGNYDVVRKLIKGYRMQIPKNEIAVRVRRLSNSADVDQLAERLANLRSTLEATRKEFTALRTMISGSTKIPNEASTGRLRSLNYGFYLEQMDQLKKEFADWSEPLSEQIETAIRTFYRQRGDVPIGDAPLEQNIRGKVLDEWVAIKQALTTRYGGYTI